MSDNDRNGNGGLCPYRLKEKIIMPSDDNKNDRIGEIKQIVFREFMSCLKDRCGIWNENKNICSLKKD